MYFQIDGVASGNNVVVKGCPKVLNVLTSAIGTMVEGCINVNENGVYLMTGLMSHQRFEPWPRQKYFTSRAPDVAQGELGW